MRQKLFIALLFFALPLAQLKAQTPDFWEGIETFDGPTDENPILAAQIDFYFDKMVAPLPDSITLEISRLVERTKNNTDLRDIILWHLLEKYRHPEYMSQDQVFVWLYDQYFSRWKIKGLNERNLALIQEKAERLRRLALFNPAPDIKLNDTLDLQSIKSKYTILFFYDHTCDLCHQEMRELDSVCNAHPEIAALKIDMNTDDLRVDELYDLYDIETTPLIYVLDKDKRIIAKKIRAKQIPIIL